MKKILLAIIAINSVLYLFEATTSAYQPKRAAADSYSFPNDDYLRALQKEFANHLRIQSHSKVNRTKIQRILQDLKITNGSRILAESIQNFALCRLCHDVIKGLQTNAITVRKVGIAICDLYSLISTWTVNTFCEDVVRINQPILEYIFARSQILDPEYACSVLLQNENCYYSSPALKWRIDIPARNQSQSSPAKNDVPNNSSTPLKILHLSDFHISQDYEINGISKCGYPVCCKKNLGSDLRKKDAGTWGDYNCDVPPWMFSDTMSYINNTHKDIDLIIFTGDIIDHTIWRDSKKDNSAEIKYVYDTLAATFPNIPVLPLLGNHEASPLNIFAPPSITDENLSQKWLYNLSAILWSKWLPSESLNTVQKQGYYSIVVNKKLRVIALNNNVCYNYNWWLLYETTFLREQLEFLKNELLEAENNGQKVYIMSHVYPGEQECVEPWEVNYNNLITRFSHIIKGQFFGHTHTDSYKVFFSKENGKPINVGYNGASFTPYVKYNPNYKILKIDPNTFDILDIDTYYFNLTAANLNPSETPNWKKLYSMKEAYSFDKLSPENFYELSKQLSVNNSLFRMYWRFYVREGDASLKDKCNNNCRKTLISSTLKVESLNYT